VAVKEVTVDNEGNPLDYFVFSISEKIGLPNYSSIDLFASIGRHLPDSPDSRQEVINEVETILERERTIIKENLGLN
jgi:hypothetical protein